MKQLNFIILFLLIASLSNAQPPEGTSFLNTPVLQMKQSIHSFNVPGITGDTIHFANFKGKKILIVNTASKCGYTPQYTDLERLYESYKNNLVIVGFPANDFKQQEPGSNEEINAFCKKNYGVTFPMAAKISVIGENIHPIYAWLTSKEKNGVMDAEVKWNFNKFLLDEEGFLLMKFDSDINPLDPEITKRIK